MNHKRPQVVAFDVIETLFSMEVLRGEIEAAGFEGHILETWFNRLLRDAFALALTGDFKSFREIADDSLKGILMYEGQEDERINRIIGGFSRLKGHEDAAPAMQMLQEAGVNIVTLTNGSAEVTGKLLENAGLHKKISHVISIDEVGKWKPCKEVYLHCASKVGVEPGRLALVAAHGWDIQGANHAGLITGYVNRGDRPFPSVMKMPDVSGASLVEVVEKLLS